MAYQVSPSKSKAQLNLIQFGILGYLQWFAATIRQCFFTFWIIFGFFMWNLIGKIWNLVFIREICPLRHFFGDQRKLRSIGVPSRGYGCWCRTDRPSLKIFTELFLLYPALRCHWTEKLISWRDIRPSFYRNAEDVGTINVLLVFHWLLRNLNK